MRNIKDTQNFLHSKELVRHLIGICNIKLDDVVIEIGPGKGIITNELAHKARKVVAIEFDEELYEKLKNKFQSNNKVDIIYGDILNYTPRIPSYCVFSNIPFNITSEILNKLAFRCLVWVSGSGGGGAGRVVWGYGYHVVVHRRPATA